MMRLRLLCALPLRRATDLIRARDWWEYKLPGFLGVAYALAFYYGVGFPTLWPLCLVVILAVASCAGYVSVINDIFDQADDQRAGKRNNMVGQSVLFQGLALGCCLVAGLTAAWFMRNCPLTLSLYALNWLAFSLYSVPPVRLKTRGTLGVLADACGGQLLPTLWVASFLLESAAHPVDWSVAGPLIGWSFALGLRGILTHQLFDLDNDRHAKLGTMATLYGPDFVHRCVMWLVFPVEIVGLVGLLITLRSPIAWFLLIVHLLVESRQKHYPRLWKNFRFPNATHWLPFGEYYKFYFPVGFTLALSARDPAAIGLLGLQLLLFPQATSQFGRDLVDLATRSRKLFCRRTSLRTKNVTAS